MKRLATLLTLGGAGLAAHAHEGHGLPGSHHWHATDVLGYVVLAAVAGAVWWWTGRK